MVKFIGMTASAAQDYRNGAPDIYGNPAEQHVSARAIPCRCCLDIVPEGHAALALAYRPFKHLHAYTETGPVFICATACQPAGAGLPKFLTSPDYLLKAYSADERIIYGTGQITPQDQVMHYASTLFARDNVAFVDLRSANNNCWLARIFRDDGSIVPD